MADNGDVTNGDRCEVIAGTHTGRSGTALDYKLSKTGHATITVREPGGEGQSLIDHRSVELHGRGTGPDLGISLVGGGYAADADQGQAACGQVGQLGQNTRGLFEQWRARKATFFVTACRFQTLAV